MELSTVWAVEQEPSPPANEVGIRGPSRSSPTVDEKHSEEEAPRRGRPLERKLTLEEAPRRGRPLERKLTLGEAPDRDAVQVL